ncbi:hypothetical protein AALB81_16120 [Lachnospiraceae bacterium 48-33]
MSADGAGIVGAAVLALATAPILIAGATVAGTVYGTVKLIEHASNSRQKSEAIRKEQERKKVAELARRTEEESRKINEIISSFNIMQSRQAEARNALNQKFASELSLATSDMKKKSLIANVNMIEIERTLKEHSGQLLSDWQRSSEQLNSSYVATINNSISQMKQTIQQGRTTIVSMQSQTMDDLRKADYTKEQIEKAKIAIIALETEFGVFNRKLKENLNQAIDYYNQGLFDNAYTMASAVVINCYDDLEEGLVQQEKIYSLLDILETKTILQKARISSLKSFTFNYKGESYEEDLTRFSPDLFSAINDRIASIENTFSSPDLVSLISMSHELDEIETDIDEVTRLSATKLLYAYTENDTAANITSAMKSQGFEMEGYAYESDVEGNSIHINYANYISKENLTVVLTPSTEGIKVNVHNFGTSSANGQEDAVRQDKIRQLIENTLNIRISCTNRGKASTNTNAANLDEVKRLS